MMSVVRRVHLPRVAPVARKKEVLVGLDEDEVVAEPGRKGKRSQACYPLLSPPSPP